MTGMRKRIVRIAYAVNAVILAVLLAAFLATGCTSEQEKLDAAKTRVAQLLARQVSCASF